MTLAKLTNAVEELAIMTMKGFDRIDKHFVKIEGDLSEIKERLVRVEKDLSETKVTVNKLEKRTIANTKCSKVIEKQQRWQYDRILDHEERIFSVEETSLN
jgi:hypothetical protein